MRAVSKEELFNRCNHLVDAMQRMIENLAVTHFALYENFDVTSVTYGELLVVPVGDEFEFSRTDELPRTTTREGQTLHLIGHTYVGPALVPYRQYRGCDLSQLPSDTDRLYRHLFVSKFGDCTHIGA